MKRTGNIQISMRGDRKRNTLGIGRDSSKLVETIGDIEPPG